MRLTWGDVVDILVRDDECVVLTADTCLRLTQVATETMLFLRRSRSPEDLEAHLLEAFGPGPEGALDAMIKDLVTHGLLHCASDDHSDDD